MCERADNSCREEKLGCEGCKFEKRKIIEIYLTEGNEGECSIDVENLDENNEVSNALMKRLFHCFSKDE